VRLFVAVDLDEDVRRRIGRIAGALKRDSGTRLKATWTRPERMHVTLHFLGEVGDDGLPDLTAKLGADIEVSPFDIALAGLGVFPSAERPRVIWLGVREGGAHLVAVHDTIARRIADLGLPLEPRAFTPHVTLARLRGHMPGTATRALASHGASQAGRCRVDAVTLYESRLGPGGSTYSALARAALVAPARPSGGDA
jgi:2'-5' RNA ligase